MNSLKPYLKKAEESDSSLPGLYRHIGNAYLKLKQLKEAELAFEKAISIDGDNSISHFGLGISYFGQKQFMEAADELLNAIGLTYFFPSAHYHLGETLIQLGYLERAAEAFEVCVSQAPGIEKAHLRLINLYRDHLDKQEEADEHERFVIDKIKKQRKKKK